MTPVSSFTPVAGGPLCKGGADALAALGVTVPSRVDTVACWEEKVHNQSERRRGRTISGAEVSYLCSCPRARRSDRDRSGHTCPPPHPSRTGSVPSRHMTPTASLIGCSHRPDSPSHRGGRRIPTGNTRRQIRNYNRLSSLLTFQRVEAAFISRGPCRTPQVVADMHVSVRYLTLVTSASCHVFLAKTLTGCDVTHTGGGAVDITAAL